MSLSGKHSPEVSLHRGNPALKRQVPPLGGPASHPHGSVLWFTLPLLSHLENSMLFQISVSTAADSAPR